MDEIQKAKENRDRIAAGIGAEGYDEVCHRRIDERSNPAFIGYSLEYFESLGNKLSEEEDLTDLDYIW